MKVFIRTDASTVIGTGHVMRCLTLAERLRQQDANVTFICRALDGGAEEMICRFGFPRVSLPFSDVDQREAEQMTGYDRWLAVDWERDARETLQVLEKNGPADWLVVDHYALDERWENSLRPFAGKLLVIDDIANRSHACDILLDQNHGHDDRRYDSLVDPDCRQLLGTGFALLRNEFYVTRQTQPLRTGDIRRVLVFYGGVDATNETGKAVRALLSSPKSRLAIDVVIGAANCHCEDIRALAASHDRVRVHSSVERMSELMARADLCLGAAGTTSWERCCLGLPAVITAVAENQISIGQAIDQSGAGKFLGISGSITEQMIIETIEHLTADPPTVKKMSQRALELVDGLGAQRVVENMLVAREATVS
jgi:UDP-2,4-diacetamido-2,4,6-trideoxy-beta-L-altropyranose hydrolase